MTSVRWGILSTAKIAREKKKIIPALRESGLHEIVAIASRSAESARAAADTFDIATAHGSYEALIEDPNVEAIYNPLPNHLHVPLTLAAVRAGKHVLCEKPFAIHAGAVMLFQRRPGQQPQRGQNRRRRDVRHRLLLRHRRALVLRGHTAARDRHDRSRPCVPDGSARQRVARFRRRPPARADQYALQCDAFAHGVRGEAPTGEALDDAAINLRVIEAVFASAKSGRVETL